jgi:uncharacterized protein (TIGR02246 family)
MTQDSPVEPAVGLDIRRRRTNMGSLSAPETDTLYDVVRKVEKVWADNDADGMAELFTEDATLVLPGEVYLKGREEIRTYFARGYAGPMMGSKVTGTPLSARTVTDSFAVLVTQGGVLAPGETAPSPQALIRATWVLARGADSEWRLTAYHNSPVNVP